MIKNQSSFAKQIRIGHKIVKDGGPVFIVAEAGLNHNGSMELAKKLIDVAYDAGADAVKFQTFKAEEENTKQSYLTLIDMLKKLEFGEEKWRALSDYCEKKNIIFLSTPSEEFSADLLMKLNVPAFKIASNDLFTIPMLERIAAFGKPMIISTGMANLAEVKEALEAVSTSGNKDIILLHCTSSYPTPPEDLNLNAMSTLKKKFGCLVGFSDHSEGIEAAPLAVLLGAVLIEKHFTLDKTLPGPDHRMSLLPDELKTMVSAVRQAERARIMLGNSEKNPTEAELETRKATHKGIVAKRHIKKGEVINAGMLAYKRPALGLPPRLYKEVIGKRVVANIAKDEFITKNLLL